VWEKGIKLFWGDCKTLAVRRSENCTILLKKQDTLIEQSLNIWDTPIQILQYKY